MFFIGGYFLWVQQKDFFKLARVRFQKQVSEVQKKWKTIIWILELDQNIANSIFQKNGLVSQEIVFHLGTTRRCLKKKFYKLFRAWNWKKKSLKHGRYKKWRFKFWSGQEIKKNLYIFLQNIRNRALGSMFFLGTNKRLQRSVIWVVLSQNS